MIVEGMVAEGTEAVATGVVGGWGRLWCMISHLPNPPVYFTRLFVAPNAVLLWVTGVAHMLLRQRLVWNGWIRSVDFSASQARQPF